MMGEIEDLSAVVGRNDTRRGKEKIPPLFKNTIRCLLGGGENAHKERPVRSRTSQYGNGGKPKLRYGYRKF